MASSYPGAVDALTNPTATDAMNSVTVPHATQHAIANDAIEAIQTELGTDPAGASATVKARLDAVDADARWTDARTPTAHKTSHEDGGSDELTLAESQVTGLTSALAGKAATVALYLPGTSGNFPSCPDASGLDVLGDIDISVHCAADDWTPAASAALVSKYTTTNGRAFEFRLMAGGNLQFAWTPSTDALQIQIASTAAPGFTDGAFGWVRVTLDVDNGASGNDVNFYTSTDGVTWTQLGTTVTTAGTTSIANSADALQVGGRGTASLPFFGKYRQAIVKSGIGGSTVASPDFRTNVGPRHRDAQANIWTLNGTAWTWSIA